MQIVMFIHGGSFIPRARGAYNGTKGVIEGEYNVAYVSINYRL